MSVAAFQTLLGVFGNLLEGRHVTGWLGSQPPGAVGEQLVEAIEDVVSVVAKSLRFHVQRGDIVPPSGRLAVRASVRNIGRPKCACRCEFRHLNVVHLRKSLQSEISVYVIMIP